MSTDNKETMVSLPGHRSVLNDQGPDSAGDTTRNLDTSEASTSHPLTDTDNVSVHSWSFEHGESRVDVGCRLYQSADVDDSVFLSTGDSEEDHMQADNEDSVFLKSAEKEASDDSAFFANSPADHQYTSDCKMVYMPYSLRRSALRRRPRAYILRSLAGLSPEKARRVLDEQYKIVTHLNSHSSQ